MILANTTQSKWFQGILLLACLLLSPIASAATKQHCDNYLKSSLPPSFKQFKNSDTKTLYQCLKVSKSTAQGSSGGYHYLSYLHNFNEGHYLFNFLRQGSQVRLQTHWIGSSKSYCAQERHGNFANFTVWPIKNGIRINQHCDNAYATAGSNDSWNSHSYRQVMFTLVGGIWRPISEEHTKSWNQKANGSGREERQIHNWSTSTYYRYKEERGMKDWFTVSSLAMDMAVGQLQTPSNTLGIANLFPRAKVALRLVEDTRAYCSKSNKPEPQSGCADLSVLESQINTKGSRYYSMMHRN